MKRIIISYNPEPLIEKRHPLLFQQLAFNIAKWNGVFECAGPYDSAFYDKVIKDLFKGKTATVEAGKNGEYKFGFKSDKGYIAYGKIQIVNIL